MPLIKHPLPMEVSGPCLVGVVEGAMKELKDWKFFKRKDCGDMAFTTAHFHHNSSGVHFADFWGYYKNVPSTYWLLAIARDNRVGGIIKKAFFSRRDFRFNTDMWIPSFSLDSFVMHDSLFTFIPTERMTDHLEFFINTAIDQYDIYGEDAPYAISPVPQTIGGMTVDEYEICCGRVDTKESPNFRKIGETYERLTRKINEAFQPPSSGHPYR